MLDRCNTKYRDSPEVISDKYGDLMVQVMMSGLRLDDHDM